jgi:hypothetical protein
MVVDLQVVGIGVSRKTVLGGDMDDIGRVENKEYWTEN